jgi:hypothetical protein
MDRVVTRAKNAGIAVQPLSMFAVERPPTAGLLFGYGGIATERIPGAIRRLGALVRAVTEGDRGRVTTEGGGTTCEGVQRLASVRALTEALLEGVQHHGSLFRAGQTHAPDRLERVPSRHATSLSGQSRSASSAWARLSVMRRPARQSGSGSRTCRRRRPR